MNKDQKLPKRAKRIAKARPEVIELFREANLLEEAIVAVRDTHFPLNMKRLKLLDGMKDRMNELLELAFDQIRKEYPKTKKRTVTYRIEDNMLFDVGPLKKIGIR